MASKNKYFELFPWIGGVNNALDAAVIPPNQLVYAKNALLGVSGSRKKRPGITFNWDSGTTGTAVAIGTFDFWWDNSNVKTKHLVSVWDDKTLHWYDTTGTKTDLSLDDTATPYPIAITDVAFETINNKLIIAVDGIGNLPKYWGGGTSKIYDIPGAPPDFSICRSHLGRIWTNDKNNPDRLHYCTTADPTQWQGVGDSGALDIGLGDGDPIGITAIFSTFKGALFVAKKTKLYKVSGFTPDTFEIELVSAGIGCISHNSITQVDQDDMVFCSERGFHSLAATANYGDFASTFISKDIQKQFNENFVKARLHLCKGVCGSIILNNKHGITGLMCPVPHYV